MNQAKILESLRVAGLVLLVLIALAIIAALIYYKKITGEGLTHALLVVAILYLLPYLDARLERHLLFRDTRPNQIFGTAMGGNVESFYGSIPDYVVTKKGEILSSSNKAGHEIIRVVWLWGLWFKGMYPRKTVYKFDFKYKQAVRKVVDEQESYVLVEKNHPDHLPFLISLAVIVNDAELQDNNRVKFISNFILEMKHAGRFLKVLPIFEEAVISILQGAIKDFVVRWPDYDTIAKAAMNEVEGDFQEAVAKLNDKLPGRPTSGLIDFAGFEIVLSSVLVVEGDKEMTEAARQEALEIAKGKGAIAKAEAEAKSIRILASAEADRLKQKIEALISEGEVAATNAAIMELNKLTGTLVLGGNIAPTLPIKNN